MTDNSNNSFLTSSEDVVTADRKSDSSKSDGEITSKESLNNTSADKEVGEKKSETCSNNTSQVSEIKSYYQKAHQKCNRLQIKGVCRRLHKKMQDPALALVVAIIAILIALYSIYRPDLLNREGTNLQNGDVSIRTTNDDGSSDVTAESSDFSENKENGEKPPVVSILDDLNSNDIEADDESSNVTVESSDLSEDKKKDGMSSNMDQDYGLTPDENTKWKWKYDGLPIELFYQASNTSITNTIYYDYEKSINLLDFNITLVKKELDYEKLYCYSTYASIEEEAVGNLGFTSTEPEEAVGNLGFTPTIHLQAKLTSNNTVECMWTGYTDEYRQYHKIEQHNGYTITEDSPYLYYEIDITNILTDTAYYCLDISYDYLENGNSYSSTPYNVEFIYVNMKKSDVSEFISNLPSELKK